MLGSFRFSGSHRTALLRKVAWQKLTGGAPELLFRNHRFLNCFARGNSSESSHFWNFERLGSKFFSIAYTRSALHFSVLSVFYRTR